MRHLIPILLILPLGATAPAGAVLAPEPTPWTEAAEQETERSESYRAGRRALDAERWSDAVESFAQAVARDEGDGDAALYWQAYALLKMNRASRAQQALTQLQQRYPESPWVDDARALEIEARRGSRQPTDPADLADEELKLIALNSLMHLEWERVRPIIGPLLQKSSSPKLLEQALFVVSQSDAPEARQMLLGFARDSNRPELAEEAIEYLAFYGDDQALADLRKLYRELADPELKEAVIEALMLAGDTPTLLEIARTEPLEELRKDAIEQIGLLGANAELKQLYGSESSVEVKEQILEALMLADDLDALVALARTEPNVELREEAIEQIGLLDGVAQLRDLYRNEGSAEIREEIAEAAMLADDVEFLLEIATSDADGEVREAAIEGLGLIGKPEAHAALKRLYQTSTDLETRLALIESFMLQDDAATLIEIVETETEPRLRKEALEALTLLDSAEATEYLLKLLRDSS